MPQLSPPPVPAKLREILREYPEHIERLQDVLASFGVPKNRVMPFDEAIWALEGRLETFVAEAREELSAAEESADASEIERAKAKELLMLQASSKGRWIGDDGLWNYFQENKEAFE
jgi:hypothetical protein